MFFLNKQFKAFDVALQQLVGLGAENPLVSQTDTDIVAAMMISTPQAIGVSGYADQPEDAGWFDFLTQFRAGNACGDSSWNDIYGDLKPGEDGMMVLGQLGQSLDGRIATVTGHSKYINGQDGLIHLHRLRALVDAVVVGAGTVVADNPKLTVRLVQGKHPARVVIDPSGRVPASSGLFQDAGVERVVLTGPQNRQRYPEGVRTLLVDRDDVGRVPPVMILKHLHALGYRRILVEGGADTVTKFMMAGCLDRVHVILAPMIIGAGRPSFDLPPIEALDQAIRIPMRMHRIGREVLLDCDLSARRSPHRLI